MNDVRDPAAPRPVGRLAAGGVLVTAVSGIGLAAYLAWHKLQLLYEPGFVSSCNVNDAVNCDRVNTSAWSELFGLPIALYAIPLYAVVAWTAFLALRASRSRDEKLEGLGLRAMGFSVGAGLIACLASVTLAAYSSVVLQTWCLLCIGLYATSLLVFGLSLVAVRTGPVRALAGLIGTLRRVERPVGSVVVVALVAAGLAWQDYSMAKASFVEGTTERIEQQIASGVGAAAVASSASSVETTTASPSVAPGVPMGSKSEEGYAFYLTPLDDQDQVFGNPNATVTVVKYADFECAFCRFFATSIKPVMDKYKDRVRFVMKQFPMNPACNPYMQGYDKHPNACHAALASVCAGKQGKYWEMHDRLYESSPRVDAATNRQSAQALGLDLAVYDACLADPATTARVRSDIQIAIKAAINGTPRTYVNGRLMTGANSAEALEYYLTKALEDPAAFGPRLQASVPPVATADEGGRQQMVRAQTTGGSFFIDPYECVVTRDGKAVSMPGVEPAMVGYDEATSACGRSGKRLCTEEEWVSACAGRAAEDDNHNSWFNDDTIEGNLYPYGLFYETGFCHDDADKGTAFPVVTGSHPDCKTASGIYDLAGNSGEWVATRPGKPGLMGGTASAGAGATCNRRASTFGVGYRNQTTGFRCCADRSIEMAPVSAEQVAPKELVAVGSPMPPFAVADSKGQPVDITALKGKVVLVTFFASWCGPCKREFPVLVDLYKKFRDRGFEVVAIGVDSTASLSLTFANQFSPTFPIVPDEASNLMGRFGVYGMPATFIADRDGIIRFKGDEFAPDVAISKLNATIEGLM